MFSNVAPTSNYDLVVETLRRISQENPNTTQWIEIGISDSGLPIAGLKIGNGETSDLIIATHHGNEYGSTAVALGAAEAFAKDPLPGHSIYVVPVLNITGYNSRTATNAPPTALSIKIEITQALASVTQHTNQKPHELWRNLLMKTSLALRLCIHTPRPFSVRGAFRTRDTGTPYDSTFIGLAKAATVESGYIVGNSKEVLYAADGAFEDYAYWKHGVWSLLFEMGTSHSPSQDQMRKMVQVNVPGLRRFFDMAPKERAENHTFTGRRDRSVMQRKILE